MTKIKSEWQLSADLIHLNHAAVGPWPQRAKLAIQNFAEDNATNGSLNYLKWVTIESALRQQLKTLINADNVDEISLLKNTSEALSVIAYGINWQSGDNIVISDQEFPSNYIVWESLKSKGVEVRYANLDSPSPEENLIALCDENTKLLSISSVQYSTGLRMQLKTLGEFCQSNNVLFCVDAIQSIGAHAIDAQDCYADFVVADGHKWMLGPEGVALFYCRESVRDQLSINQFGWRMVEDFLNFDNKNWEIAKNGRRFECGSPNMLGIHGLHASLSLILEVGIESISHDIEQKINLLMTGLKNIPGTHIITPTDPKRRCGIVTFYSDKIDTEKLFDYLSSKNVFCAMRGGGIRLSPHYHTTDKQLLLALSYVSEIHKKT